MFAHASISGTVELFFWLAGKRLLPEFGVIRQRVFGVSSALCWPCSAFFCCLAALARCEIDRAFFVWFFDPILAVCGGCTTPPSNGMEFGVAREAEASIA